MLEYLRNLSLFTRKVISYSIAILFMLSLVLFLLSSPTGSSPYFIVYNPLYFVLAGAVLLHLHKRSMKFSSWLNPIEHRLYQGFIYLGLIGLFGFIFEGYAVFANEVLDDTKAKRKVCTVAHISEGYNYATFFGDRIYFRDCPAILAPGTNKDRYPAGMQLVLIVKEGALGREWLERIVRSPMDDIPTDQ